MFIRLRNIAPTLVALGAVVACSTPPSATRSSSSGTSSAAPAAVPLTALADNVHPLTRRAIDLGRRDPGAQTAGSIYLKPSAAQQAERDALVLDIQNPASPHYHKWLSVEEYAARFGASQADIARVGQWLQDQGFTVNGPSRLGTRIGFSASGSQFEAAFHTELHDYSLKGKPHYAMASAPMIPTGLASAVLGLKGFHDFHPHHPQLRHVTPKAVDPIYGEIALAPSDFEVLYNTKPLTAAGTTGKGVNLVIVGETYFNPADLTNFRSHFDITGVNQVNVLVPNTGTSKVNDEGDEGETELDLEWASAVAPGANIVFVYTGSNQNYSVDDAAAYAIEEGAHLVPGTGNGAAQIISESYGGCDLEYSGSDQVIDTQIAAAANLEGITYLAATGDSAAAGCIEDGVGGLYVGPPSSLPGVTGVGGTEFCGDPSQAFGCFYTGAAGANVQQAPWFVNNFAAEYPVTNGASLEGIWNDSDLTYGPGGGGGGASVVFPKPFYQQGVAGMPNDGARDLPDISLTAAANNVPYLVWEETQLIDGGPADTLGPIGGTSASTPSFAGIVARINQAVVAGGGTLGLGNINPQLYALFSTNAGSGAFHDIVVGDNIVPCNANDPTDYPDCPVPPGAFPDGGTTQIASTYGGYSAHTGYDLASGLGTVDAEKLVTAWVALTPTATTLVAPTSTTVSAPVTLSATVTSASASNTNPIGGTVTFAFHNFAGDAGTAYATVDAGGGIDESWVLGTVNVTAGTGSPATGTATLSATIPGGLHGQSWIGAEYSGDTHYLASRSTPQAQIGVTGATLAITPATLTLAPNAIATLTATGGAPGVTWSYVSDTSCLVSNGNYYCSNVEPTSPTTAAFQAGGKAGSVTIAAIDTLGEEARITITVSGKAVDAGAGLPVIDDAGPQGGPLPGPTPDAGAPIVNDDAGTTGGDDDAGGSPVGDDDDDDAGTPGSDDAGFSVSDDAGVGVIDTDSGLATLDAGGGNGASGSGSSGCGCAVAGANDGVGSREAGLGGLLLGLVVLGRRRARRR